MLFRSELGFLLHRNEALQHRDRLRAAEVGDQQDRLSAANTIPIVFALARFTAIPVQLVYLLAELSNLIKCIVGYVLVKRGVWIKNIVD